MVACASLQCTRSRPARVKKKPDHVHLVSHVASHIPPGPPSEFPPLRMCWGRRLGLRVYPPCLIGVSVRQLGVAVAARSVTGRSAPLPRHKQHLHFHFGRVPPAMSDSWMGHGCHTQLRRIGRGVGKRLAFLTPSVFRLGRWESFRFKPAFQTGPGTQALTAPGCNFCVRLAPLRRLAG